jgi:phosphatidylserine decarboxylase
MENYGIVSGQGFLEFANWIVSGWVPTETVNGRDIYYILCIFYFVLDQPPLKEEQTKICPGEPLTPLSHWVVEFAQQIGNHMNEKESFTDASRLTFWNSPSYHVYEADESKTEGGRWKNFNDFFCRYLKDGVRPITGKYDDNIAVFPADSTFSGWWPMREDSTVNLKGLPWDIGELLGPYKRDYKDCFKGGIWMHSFLNTFDYHRQHAPVSGKVLVIDVIPGAAYLDVVYQDDDTESGTGSLVLKRSMQLASHGTAEATDKEGYQFLQARGIIIIESSQFGKVAVLPIGMAQVSSVVPKKGLKPMDYVRKGDEISHFEFGGSDIVLMFQKDTLILDSLPKPNSAPIWPPLPPHYNHYKYGEQLALANPQRLLEPGPVKGGYK